jgi:hypothetical protein
MQSLAGCSTHGHRYYLTFKDYIYQELVAIWWKTKFEKKNQLFIASYLPTVTPGGGIVVSNRTAEPGFIIAETTKRLRYHQLIWHWVHSIVVLQIPMSVARHQINYISCSRINHRTVIWPLRLDSKLYNRSTVYPAFAALIMIYENFLRYFKFKDINTHH